MLMRLSRDRPTDSAAANSYFWSIVSREKLQPLSVSALAERPIPSSVVRGFASAETSMCCALVNIHGQQCRRWNG